MSIPEYLPGKIICSKGMLNSTPSIHTRYECMMMMSTGPRLVGPDVL